jgi:phage major head subunit gpT-like protein
MPNGVAGGYDLLNATEQTYRAAFMQAYEETQAKWDAFVSMLAMTMSTPGIAQVNHRFADPVPQMTEWNGDRRIGKLGVKGFSISNTDYSNGVEIGWPDLRRDQLNIYMPRIRQLAEKAALLKLKLLINLLDGGFTANGYDGTPFFGDSHTDGFDNLTTDQLDQAAYQDAITRLRAVKDAGGEPMDLAPTHLIVASDLEWMGKEILMQERLASGETNITQGTAQLIVSNRLTAKHWFVGDLSHAEKPFIVQTEEPVTATMLDKPDDPDRFHRNKLIFGAQTAVGAGYAWPHFIQGSNGQGS